MTWLQTSIRNNKSYQLSGYLGAGAAIGWTGTVSESIANVAGIPFTGYYSALYGSLASLTATLGATTWSNAALAALGAPYLTNGLGVFGNLLNTTAVATIGYTFASPVPAGASFMLVDPGASLSQLQGRGDLQNLRDLQGRGGLDRRLDVLAAVADLGQELRLRHHHRRGLGNRHRKFLRRLRLARRPPRHHAEHADIEHFGSGYDHSLRFLGADAAAHSLRAGVPKRQRRGGLCRRHRHLAAQRPRHRRRRQCLQPRLQLVLHGPGRFHRQREHERPVSQRVRPDRLLGAVGNHDYRRRDDIQSRRNLGGRWRRRLQRRRSQRHSVRGRLRQSLGVAAERRQHHRRRRPLHSGRRLALYRYRRSQWRRPQRCPVSKHERHARQLAAERHNGHGRQHPGASADRHGFRRSRRFQRRRDCRRVVQEPGARPIFRLVDVEQRNGRVDRDAVHARRAICARLHRRLHHGRGQRPRV